jgi:O-antigen/teichoic acid export membrane protein
MTKVGAITSEGTGVIAAGGLPLRINFIWTLFGNVVYAGCQWGLLAVISKLGTPEMVGQFSLGLAVTAPIILLTNLHLRAVQVTDVRQNHLFGHYLALRLFSTGLALAIICAVVFLSGYRKETLLVILLVGLSKAIESISDVIFGLLQQHERMDLIATSMMIKGLLSLTALGVCVWLTGRVAWGVLGLVAAWVTVLLLYDARNAALLSDAIPRKNELTSKKKVNLPGLVPNWNFERLTSLAWVSLPLGISAMMISLNINIPRYFIHHQLGERDLGIFAAMAYLMVVGRMIVGALGQSASPRLAKYAGLGRIREFCVLLLKLTGVAAVIGVAGLILAKVAGRQILTLIYNSEYAERIDVFFWLMMTAGLSYIASCLGYGMTALRLFKSQIPLFTLVGMATALLCYQMMPVAGLKGAAQAMLVASLFQVFLTLSAIWYALRKLVLISRNEVENNA